MILRRLQITCTTTVANEGSQRIPSGRSISIAKHFLRWWTADLGDPLGEGRRSVPCSRRRPRASNGNRRNLQDARTVFGATKASNSEALLT